MDAAKLDRFRTTLNEQLVAIQGTLERARSDYSEAVETQPDMTDQASVDWDRNFDMRLRDRERRMVAKIREALARLEAGAYGICESCDEPISEKRLLARPVTTLCIDCKAEAEQLEKQHVEGEE